MLFIKRAMTTQIVYGNPNQILAMQKQLCKISIVPIPPLHGLFLLIQQISFCFSKSGQSCLLKLIHAAFLLITWKLIFRRGVVLWSHLRDYTFNRLSQFFTFHLILSNHFRLQTVRRFSTRTHLSHAFHLFTNTCLPHGKPCSIKLNFILDSSFPGSAWLCCHTHAHHTCSMLLFHSATTMQLHHVINLHYACPKQYQ